MLKKKNSQVDLGRWEVQLCVNACCYKVNRLFVSLFIMGVWPGINIFFCDGHGASLCWILYLAVHRMRQAYIADLNLPYLLVMEAIQKLLPAERTIDYHHLLSGLNVFQK